MLLPHPDGPMNAVMVPLNDFDRDVAYRLELAVVQFRDFAIDQSIALLGCLRLY